MIGLVAGSHGFFLSWDPLVHASLTFLCVSILLA
jgi:hypothetical protein